MTRAAWSITLIKDSLHLLYMMLTRLKMYLQKESNQAKLNRILCIFFIVGVILNFIRASLFYWSDPLMLITSDAFELLFLSTVAFFFYYMLRSVLKTWKVFLSILGALVLIVLLTMLKAYRRGLPITEDVFDRTMGYVGVIFICLSLFYLFEHLNLIVNNSYERAKASLYDAEKKLLRAQFNPHFLFNAFNSLYSMSLQNHPKTSESILKLSGMMRYLTDDVNVSGVLLVKELSFIADYLEIERIRFGAASNINFKIIGDSTGKLIEPLLLITLVENAFKHGFYTNHKDAFVDISAEIGEAFFLFKVKNSVFLKQHFQEKSREGKGLEQLKMRLTMSYPDAHEFIVHQTDQDYLTTLKINLR